jgi:hypothetical protein
MTRPSKPRAENTLHPVIDWLDDGSELYESRAIAEADAMLSIRIWLFRVSDVKYRWCKDISFRPSLQAVKDGAKNSRMKDHKQS